MCERCRFDFAEFSGKGVRIGVIDSGIDGTHPDLQGAVRGGVAISVDSDGMICCHDDHSDVSGHGTACAGLIRKIAPEARLYSIRILDENLESYSEVLAEGIIWATENDVDIVNLSLGTSNEDLKATLREACEQACERNVLIVAAGQRLGPRQYPAGFPNVFGVGGADIAGPYAYVVKAGEEVEFLTGDQEKVPWLNHTYTFRSGASFAAAHFTGIIALIRERHPDSNYEQVRQILLGNALGEGVDARRSPAGEDRSC